MRNRDLNAKVPFLLTVNSINSESNTELVPCNYVNPQFNLKGATK